MVEVSFTIPGVGRKTIRWPDAKLEELYEILEKKGALAITFYGGSAR